MRALRLAVMVTLLSPTALADEGMWPFNMVPAARIKKDHGVDLSKDWLDHLRLASARLSSGGSSSFVSPKGLLLTNHHVASDCIAKLDAQGKNYMQNGYLAGRDGPEATCPDIEAMVLQSMEEVTARVVAARKPAMSDAEANVAIKGAMSSIEKECGDKTGLKCEVVTLYAGGRYDLYAYKRYTDVRLVFAPEADIAFFGGDPDNFTYPRYDVDMALFRVYEGGKPLEPKHWLKWSKDGAKDGAVAFVSGHPGGTNRMNTVAQLEKIRDVTYPYVLDALGKTREAVLRYAAEGSEQKRETREEIFGLENSIKALTGELGGLKDPALMKKKKDEEAALLAKIDKDPKLKADFGTVWADVKKVQAGVTPELTKRYRVLERGGGGTTLLGFARALVRWHDETALPNEKRLREFRESNLESMKLELLSPAPVYGGVEAALLRAWLERADRDLAKNDPLRGVIFAQMTPEARARDVVSRSRLFDVYARKKLLDGKDALAASDDPAISLMRAIDAEARAARKKFEDAIEAPMRSLGEKVARATFAAYGSDLPPDATFTLRLSVGVVRGYTEGGKAIPFATDFDGMYAHATGKDPFKLPPRWLDKKPKVAGKTQLNFVTTDDIIGGNSGSPVVDTKGELIGLIFDGNLSSLPNRFVYREVTERAVSVDTAGMLEALRDVYEAQGLVRELAGP